MTIYLNRVLMKVSLSALVLLTLLSCDATIHEGDPAIVADFDFARAWKEAVPTTGAIVELDSVYLAQGTVVYATSYRNKYHEVYEYKYENSDSYLSDWFLAHISKKAIINDIGDTIFESKLVNKQYKNTGIYALGRTNLYYKINNHVDNTDSKGYLSAFNERPYDLMATMRSTYNSIKYLQTIYPDSLIPFSVFEN